ncbi:MAG: DUF3341 domain-containing protein [Gemmatimonadetes bacterium]|nr:DUF3341 domain-containing protein [Gemmatimonadota bacterium]
MRRNGQAGLVASFAHLDATLEAIEALKKRNFTDITVFTPLPEHHLEEALGRGESPVRLFTLVGGLTGAASGFAIATWTSLDWPLVTGGKPIVSIPPFVIIAFELTILFGAIATFVGMFINARLPRVGPLVVYDPEFSAGHFGVHVRTEPVRLREVREVLEGLKPEALREEPREAVRG